MYRVGSYILVEICNSRTESDWIFANKSPRYGVVVPSPIKIDFRLGVVPPAREDVLAERVGYLAGIVGPPVAVCSCGVEDQRVAVGVPVVGFDDRAAGIGQRRGPVQRVLHGVISAGGVGRF